MAPGASEAIRATTSGTGEGACADKPAGRHTSATSPPTTADAIDCDVTRMLGPCVSASGRASPLGRADGEVDVPCQRFVRDLVGNLDLQAILPFGEARQRHRLPALQLVAGGQVELRRQRLRVQVLRIGLVEELLRAAGLRVEVVLDDDVRL